MTTQTAVKRRYDMLQINQVRKDFSGLEVLKEVTFNVKKNESHAIIGPNGAGKTTLFNIISGKFKPSGGKVIFKGADISNKPPHIRNRMKLSRSFQITNVFAELNVFDNVLAGVRCHQGLLYNFFKSPLSNAEIKDKTTAIIEQVGLEENMQTTVRELSYGQQRALEIGVTLSTDPELILLDEPTAGMTREETGEAIELIHKVSENRSLLIIEHDMDVVFTLADTISVLHYGTILASDTPENIRNDQRVKDAYLGEEEE
jgi:branched-chain amino acid transport system ATP-binding protein